MTRKSGAIRTFWHSVIKGSGQKKKPIFIIDDQKNRKSYRSTTYFFGWICCRISRGCVSWKNMLEAPKTNYNLSHLTWVRELKILAGSLRDPDLVSHPTGCVNLKANKFLKRSKSLIVFRRWYANWKNKVKRYAGQMPYRIPSGTRELKYISRICSLGRLSYSVGSAWVEKYQIRRSCSYRISSGMCEFKITEIYAETFAGSSHCVCVSWS